MVKPYYYDEKANITLYHGDSREILPQIQGDLVLTDFPYAINESYDIYQDTEENLKQLISDLVPLICRAAPVALISCGIKNLWSFPKPTWLLNWVWQGGSGRGPWGFICNQPVLAYGADPHLKNCLGSKPDTIFSGELSPPNGHPCPKPLNVWKWFLLRGSVKESDLVIDPLMGCYDDQTEVLTKSGWKYFKDITCEDKFITRDSRGRLSYQHHSKYYRYMYTGEMVKIKGRSIDLLVTPNHNIVARTHADFCAGRTVPRFIRADNLDMRLYRVPCLSKFRPGSIFTDSLMYLIGLYVSEGYIEKQSNGKDWRVVICQNKGSKMKEMMRRVSVFSPKLHGPRKFTVELTKDVVSFIIANCGKYCRNKFISPTILNGGNLQPLFNAMVLGDGSITKLGQISYFTTSKKLADAMQEIALKLGYEGVISFREPRDSILRGRKISKENCGVQYRVAIKTSKEKKIITKDHVSRVQYSGEVFCVTVPNHTLYVRRNGWPSWCGNSGISAVAAKQLGRRFIGIELSEKYCALAVDLLRQEVIPFDNAAPLSVQDTQELLF